MQSHLGRNFAPGSCKWEQIFLHQKNGFEFDEFPKPFFIFCHRVDSGVACAAAITSTSLAILTT
jgi:hypothetical protein